ncbi:MAG: APC family permease [Bacillota bacterium]|nr:APC family permease [Bacillota bacterium]
MRDNKNTLSKVLGRTDIIAIGFGTMVGWSWIVLTTTWVTEAGLLGALLAFGIGGLIILGVGLIYGELTAALPLAGGEFVFAYRAMGNKAAWLVGWIMSMAYLGVAAWEGIALATAVNYIIPIPLEVPLLEVAGYQVYFSWAVVGMVGALIITLLNLFGIRPAVLFQVLATAALLVVVIVMVIGGFTFGSTDNIGTLVEDGSGFFYVLLMVPAMLIGFDVIPQSAEEMNIGPKNIGKMVIVCIVLSLIWYLLMILGTAFAAPVEVRTSGIIPMADVAAYLFKSSAFSYVMIFGGILGIVTSWNGFFLGATRLVYAMGRAQVLPKVFGRVHRKYKTPWAATLLVGSICIIAPLLGRNALVWFVDISSLCALMAYCLVIISFIILRKKEEELLRPFKIKIGMPFGVVALLVVFSYLLLYILDNFSFSEIDPEFLITVLWLLLGLILAVAARLRKHRVSAEEREMLIFGEKYARRRDKYEK